MALRVVWCGRRRGVRARSCCEVQDLFLSTLMWGREHIVVSLCASPHMRWYPCHVRNYPHHVSVAHFAASNLSQITSDCNRISCYISRNLCRRGCDRVRLACFWRCRSAQI